MRDYVIHSLIDSDTYLFKSRLERFAYADEGGYVMGDPFGGWAGVLRSIETKDLLLSCSPIRRIKSGHKPPQLIKVHL